MNRSNNAYKVYVCLHKKHHRGRDPMPLRECINNLTHSLLQQGLDMRQRGYGAPPSATKDISTSSSGEGRSIRSDSNRQPFETQPDPHGTGALHTGSTRTPVSSITPRALYYQQAAFKTLKRKQPGRSYQSQAMIANSSGRDCRYKKCLAFNEPRKRTRSYPTRYRCEECTQEKGIDLWLCNTVNRIPVMVPLTAPLLGANFLGGIFP
jgi:hypothetical protein